MKNNLQALRGVAAIMVVLFHTVNGLHISHEGAAIWRVFTYWGQAGVDLFFVISGFVMVYAQARSPKTLGVFLRGRAIRILPLYWLLTMTMVALLLAVPQMFNAMRFDPLLTLTSLTMTTWAVLRDFPVVYVGWTLEYEILFYLVFGLAMAVMPLPWTVVPVTAVFGLGMATGLLNDTGLEFVFGMLIGLAALRWQRLPGAWLVLALGLSGFAATIPGDLAGARVVLWGVPAGLVVLALVFLPQTTNRTMIWLGAASYSIYLVQVLAIPLALRLLRLLPGDGAALGFTGQALAVTAFSVLAGALLYKLIEAPVTDLLGRMVRKGSPRTSPARGMPDI